ncbi:MAG: hypothetical protein PHU14_00260 [Methylovulum sp.]|nr:hypothetical protein [Methylovulum sp.]
MVKNNQEMIPPRMPEGITIEQIVEFSAMRSELTVLQAMLLTGLLIHECNEVSLPVKRYPKKESLKQAPLLPYHILLEMLQAVELERMGLVILSESQQVWQLTIKGKTLAQFLMHDLYIHIQHTLEVQKSNEK